MIEVTLSGRLTQPEKGSDCDWISVKIFLPVSANKLSKQKLDLNWEFQSNKNSDPGTLDFVRESDLIKPEIAVF